MTATPVSAADPQPSPSTGPAQRGADDAVDVVALDGGRLYHLDKAGGLLVYDVSRPDHPRRLGRHAIAGEPLGVVVRGGIATLVLREHDSPFAGNPFHAETHEGAGLLRAVDLRDPEHGRVLGETVLPGDVRDARATADSVYVLSELRGAQGARVVVTAAHLDGSDAGATRAIERDGTAGALRTLPGSVVVAYAGSHGPGTRVELLGDARGRPLWVRGAVALGSTLAYGDRETAARIDAPDAAHVRVLACRTVICGTDDALELATIDATDADHPRVASTRTVRSPGISPVTRFGGDRLYVARRDWLALGTPSTPVTLVDLAARGGIEPRGQVVEGVVRDLVVAGPQLLVLGTRTDEDGAHERLFLDVVDVRDPQRTAYLGDVLVGEGSTTSAALQSSRAVAVRGPLVAFPYRSSGAETMRGGVALVELRPGAPPRKAGEVAVDGSVQRVLFVGPRLLAVTDVGLWSIDVDLLRAPRVADVELAAR